MIGIIVQLGISWLIIWWYEKGNLHVLGLLPSKKRVKDFFLFFIVAAACSSLTFLLRHYIALQSWEMNPDFSLSTVLEGTWFVIKSVLFEELIFRGGLFYILIKKLGTITAVIVSSIAFGIYHWFSFEVWGDGWQMLITFLVTGLAGVIYAYGYVKTFSLYVPVALHIGWNIVNMVIFSNSTIGRQLLIPVEPAPVVTISYFSYYAMQFTPVLCFYIINGWLLWRFKQEKLL